MENNDNNKELLNALNSEEALHIGQEVSGEILSIDDDQAVLGIDNTGVEGVIPKRELSINNDTNIHDLISIGGKISAIIIRSGNADKDNQYNYVLSKRRLDARKLWDSIETKASNEEIVQVKVTQAQKSGVVVDVDGLRGFIPGSMLETYFVNDFQNYVGKTLACKIVEIEPSDNRLILSSKVVKQEQQHQKAKEVISKLLPGDVVTGKVVRMTNFGAFVEIDGVDGLIHLSEISYDHIDKPSDVLEVNQEVTVKVINSDPDNERLGLSIKQAQPSPWEQVKEQIKIGSILHGKVSQITDFGAFVEVLPGIEGLVHISQISHKHIAMPSDVLKIGQDVNVKVISLDIDKQRLGLSIKALDDNHNENNDAEKEDIQKYLNNDSTGFSIGDLTNLE